MASKNTNITFDILAKDNASKVFDKMSDKLSTQERALNGLRVAGTAQFVALAASAGLFAKKSIDSARDLGETVNMATVIFGDQADEMIKWADTAYKTAGLSKQAALQATATFGDMFSQLKFTGDEAASMSLSTVQLAADLGSFRDLPTEDVLLRIQAAMRGEFDSLKLLIPNISAARVETEALAASGKSAASELTAQDKVAATLAIIQKDASKATGDFARTSGSLANQQKSLSGASENLAAIWGEDLLPAAQKIAGVALDAIEWTSEHQAATKVLVVTIGTLSTAIAIAANWQAIHTTATTMGVAAEWLWNTAKGTSNATIATSIPLKEADAAATAASMVAVMGLTGSTGTATAVKAANNAALAAAIPIKEADAAATVTSMAAIMGLTAATAASTTATSASTAANKANATGMGKLAGAAGPVALALAGLAATGKMMADYNNDLVSFSTGAGEATQGLLNIADGTDTLETAFADMFSASEYLNSADDALQILTAPSNSRKINDFIGGIFGSGDLETMQAEELFTTLDEGLSSLVQSGNAETAAQALENMGFKYEDISALLPGYADALANAENQTRLSTDATEDGTGATEEAADAVLTLVDALAEQIKKQHEAAGIVLDENSALRDYQQAIDDASAAIEENGRTLDVNTQQGRDNQANLDDIASSTWDWIDAGSAAGESQIVLADRMGQGRQSFIDTATQLGLTADEAAALADQMGLVPTAIVTDITLTGYADTYRYLTSIQAAIRGITGNSAIRVAMGAGGSGGLTFAGGGPISGPGSSTSDSVPIWASDGEYMQNAAAHQFWGTPIMNAMNNRDVAGFFSAMSLEGFAGGGSLSAATLAGASAMGVYRGLPATSRGVSPSGARGGGDTYVLVDTEGTLLATMRGAADNSARFTQQARSAAVRGGGRR